MNTSYQNGENDFWTKKLERNINRDKTQSKLLEDAGWSIIRVWESDLMKKKTRQAELEKIADFLKDPPGAKIIREVDLSAAILQVSKTIRSVKLCGFGESWE